MGKKAVKIRKKSMTKTTSQISVSHCLAALSVYTQYSF